MCELAAKRDGRRHSEEKVSVSLSCEEERVTVRTYCKVRNGMSRTIRFRSGGFLQLDVSDYMSLDKYDREFINELLEECDQYELDIDDGETNKLEETA